MQRHRYFEGLTSESIFDIMKKMLDERCCAYFFTENDYEWVIGSDVWGRISYYINDFNVGLIYKVNDLLYKIFDIEITISKDELNTITLRKKNERRNEMPFENHFYFDYSKITYTEPIKAIPSIKNVIFNDPATIVIWQDGSKTVVKCQDGEIYDPEKGLAMAISKKALGNQGNYCNVFKKWLPEEEEVEGISITFDSSEFNKRVDSLLDSINSKFPLKKEDLLKKGE